MDFSKSAKDVFDGLSQSFNQIMFKPKPKENGSFVVEH